MTKIKKIMFILIVLLFTMVNILEIKAAFDLDTMNANYDMTRGILNIYDSKFLAKGYSANLNKIQIGNIPLNGSYRFDNGIATIYVSNRDQVNAQYSGYDDLYIPSGIYMQSGAIVHTYTPPGGINVVLDSPSNEKALNLQVITPKPIISIQAFYPNIATVNGNGGNISLILEGNHLYTNSIKIFDTSNATYYSMPSGTNSTSILLNIPANTTCVDKIYQYVLFLNDIETNWKLTITSLPKEKDDKKVKDNEKSSKRWEKSEDKKERDKDTPKNKKEDSLNDTKSSISSSSKKKDNTHLKKNEKNNSSTKKEDEFYVYLLIIIVCLLLGYSYYFYHKKRNKKD